MCNCGVAIRAGRDVFVVSTCDNQIQIGYTQCDDAVLVVKKETDLTYSVVISIDIFSMKITNTQT